MTLPGALAVSISAVLRQGVDRTDEAALLEGLARLGWTELDPVELSGFLQSSPRFVEVDERWAEAKPTLQATQSAPVARYGRPANSYDTPAQAGPSLRWDNLTAEMSAAVRDELSKKRAEQSSRDIPLSRGVVIGVVGPNRVIRFIASSDVSQAEATTVQVQMAGEWSEAELVTITGDTVTLSVSKAAKYDLGSATLRIDPSFLLAALAKRLDDLRCFSGDFDVEAAAAITEPAQNAAHLHDVWSSRLSALNEDQCRAVQVGMQPGRTYLWGPPGTGKTTTVAALIATLLDEGKRVLVVSNTNAAVDVAMAKLLQLLSADGGWTPDSIVRVGAPADESLAEHPGGFVLADEIVAQRGEPLAIRKRELESQLVALRKLDRLLRDEREALEDVMARPNVLEQTLGFQRGLIDKTRQELAAAEANAGRLRAAVLRAEQHCLARGEIMAREAQVVNASRTITSIRRRLDAEMRELDETHAALPAATVAAEEPAVASRFAEVDEEKRATEVQLADTGHAIRAIHAELKALRQLVLCDAQLVFATVHRTYLSEAKNLKFDVVIVDEASMVSIPLAICAAGLGVGHTVFAGDFRQLAPIAEAETSGVDSWLKRSPFEAAGITSAAELGELPTSVVVLPVQHRMKAEIASVVSRAFYPLRPLVTPSSVASRFVDASLTDLLPQNSLWLLDSSELGPRLAQESGLRSRYNIVHAQLILAIIARMNDHAEVGLIAPYASQARLLKAIAEPATLEAATVHRFQGGERDFIVFDTVEAEGHGIGLSRWFGESSVGSDGARLLNVALSRARDRLLVVADLNRLSKTMQAAGPVAEAYREIRDRAAELSWMELVTGRGTPTVLVEQANYTAALARDIGSASKSVEIASASAGVALLDDLEPSLVAASQTGAAVRIVMRPPTDQLIMMRVENLRNQGVTVEFRDPVRENYLIVDSGILWSRSADMLARGNGVLSLRSSSRHLAGAVSRLAARKRLPGDPPAAAPYEVSICPSCSSPRTRVERWDGRAWDQCSRCSRKAGSGARDSVFPERNGGAATYYEPTAAAWSRRRADGLTMSAHFLVDDK